MFVALVPRGGRDLRGRLRRLEPAGDGVLQRRWEQAKTASKAKPARRSRGAPSAVTLPPSIRIAGVRVGTLAPARAERVVQKAFNKPLTVVVDKLRLRVDPAKLAKPVRHRRGRSRALGEAGHEPAARRLGQGRSCSRLGEEARSAHQPPSGEGSA